MSERIAQCALNFISRNLLSAGSASIWFLPLAGASFAKPSFTVNVGCSRSDKARSVESFKARVAQ